MLYVWYKKSKHQKRKNQNWSQKIQKWLYKHETLPRILTTIYSRKTKGKNGTFRNWKLGSLTNIVGVKLFAAKPCAPCSTQFATCGQNIGVCVRVWESAHVHRSVFANGRSTANSPSVCVLRVDRSATSKKGLEISTTALFVRIQRNLTSWKLIRMNIEFLHRHAFNG